MKSYESPAAFRNALDERIRKIARERNLSILRCRKELAFDRLLARLLKVAPGLWMLKGAIALEFRFAGGARTSLDVDIEGFDRIEQVDAVLQQAAESDLNDFFDLEIRRSRMGTSAIGEIATYNVVAQVGASIFDEVRIDVQIGRREHFAPDIVMGPDYLAFIGAPQIEVPTLPLTIQIAEKVHALTRTYKRGNTSTRVKDLTVATLRQATEGNS